MSTKDKKSFDERVSDLNKKNAADLRKSWGEVQTAGQPLKKPFLFITLALALFTILALNAPSDQERYCDDTDSASRLAYATAVVHVRQRLNDLDSAEFPPQPMRVSRTGECSFMIVGTVRARNAFGELVQNTYVAQTEYDIAADHTRATLISLD